MTLNARINARLMPRERAEHALRELALLKACEERIFERSRKAHLAVAEQNLNNNWGVYREDVGVDPREFDAVIERDAWQVGSEAVARALPNLDGRREYLTALLDHALADWSVQLRMPPRNALLKEHLHFNARHYGFYKWVRMPYMTHLRYTVLGCRVAALESRALPRPSEVAA